MVAREHIDEVFRAEYSRVFAALVRRMGDFQEAEDAIQDAFLVAVDRWPREGLPRRPGAWITTVAWNAVLSRRRHMAVAGRKHEELAEQPHWLAAASEDEDIPDDRLRLIFICCHPALAEEARVALTLQVVCGLKAKEIARLFLQPEAAVAQRLVRAKRKIREAAISFELPSSERIPERLEAVLAVVYLLFTSGYSSSEEGDATRAVLCGEAIRLGRVLCQLMPAAAEVRGLLALMLLHDARRAARVDSAGELVSLEVQDRALWDAAMIQEGVRLLDEAMARNAPGPYQIQAAIAALHATARSYTETDWAQIAALYENLWWQVPSPAVAVGWVVARGMADGPERGLELLESFIRDGTLRGSDRVPATRAELLRRAGQVEEAREAYRNAIRLARNPREARFLERRFRALEGAAGDAPRGADPGLPSAD